MRRRPPRDLAPRHAAIVTAAALEQREREQADWEAAWSVLSSVLWGTDEAASNAALALAAELLDWKYPATAVAA